MSQSDAWQNMPCRLFESDLHLSAPDDSHYAVHARAMEELRIQIEPLHTGMRYRINSPWILGGDPPLTDEEEWIDLRKRIVDGAVAEIIARRCNGYGSSPSPGASIESTYPHAKGWHELIALRD